MGKDLNTMDLLISRILKYLNGCLDNDYKYKIGNFIVKNYTKICHYSLEKVLEEGHFQESEVIDFCQHLGFDSFDSFQQKLMMDHQLRSDQIQSRMLNVDVNDFVDHIQTSLSHDEFLKLIDELCELIFRKKRIVIIGALYPTSVSVDFQTDLITLGKEVVEYHQFDTDFEFSDDDIVILISATGRTMKSYISIPKLKSIHICEAYLVLVTQNIKYTNYENVCADYVIHVQGKFDGIQFNYQTMMVLDILRIRYYQKYYQ